MKIKSVLLFLCCFFISACVTITPVRNKASGEAPEGASQEAEAYTDQDDQVFTPGTLPVVYLNIDGGHEEIDSFPFWPWCFALRLPSENGFRNRQMEGRKGERAVRRAAQHT